MRILITGGAGCLGSNLIEHWLPKGHDICVIDNFATGKREVVPEMHGLRVVEGSIVDAALVSRVTREFKPEIVIHAAAAYKDPADWHEDAATNVLGSINVIRAAEEVGAKQVVNFQTALCYGRPSQVPIPADHPTGPFTSYGISKTAGEAVMRMSSLPVLSLRLANVTGPRLAIGPIPTFYKRLKNGQSCFCSDTVRDFLDMRDFLDFMDLVVAGEPRSGTYNLSTGEGHTIKEIFDIVADHLGMGQVDVPIVAAGDDDVQAVVLDPVETMRVFGWEAKISFEHIIRGQLAWYDAHGVNDVFSHLKPATTE